MVKFINGTPCPLLQVAKADPAVVSLGLHPYKDGDISGDKGETRLGIGDPVVRHFIFRCPGISFPAGKINFVVSAVVRTPADPWLSRSIQAYLRENTRRVAFMAESARRSPLDAVIGAVDYIIVTIFVSGPDYPDPVAGVCNDLGVVSSIGERLFELPYSLRFHVFYLEGVVSLCVRYPDHPGGIAVIESQVRRDVKSFVLADFLHFKELALIQQRKHDAAVLTVFLLPNSPKLAVTVLFDDGSGDV
jgi:hypothetical protein